VSSQPSRSLSGARTRPHRVVVTAKGRAAARSRAAGRTPGASPSHPHRARVAARATGSNEPCPCPCRRRLGSVPRPKATASWQRLASHATRLLPGPSSSHPRIYSSAMWGAPRGGRGAGGSRGSGRGRRNRKVAGRPAAAAVMERSRGAAALHTSRSVRSTVRSPLISEHGESDRSREGFECR
jgi:hypothetical protein